MSETQTSTPAPALDQGDHDVYAHYVVGGTEAILRAVVDGIPCTALCGKTWLPHRDPTRYPICPTCAEIRLGAESGES